MASTPLSLSTQHGKINSTWTIAFDKQMSDFEIDQLVRPKINPDKIVSLDKISLPSKNDLYVGWSAFKIVTTPNPPLLYSSDFSVCIAVLVRGFKQSNSSNPSHLGLAHVMGSPEIIEPMILEIDQETDHGPIEIFICGGYRSDNLSENNYKNLMERIKTLSQNKPNIQVLDDQFGIMDIPGFYLVDKKQTAYTGSPGLDFAGFDANHNPYAVLGVTFRYFTGSRKDVVKFMREENSEIVDCLFLQHKEEPEPLPQHKEELLPAKPSASNHFLQLYALLSLSAITLYAAAKIYKQHK